MADELHRNYSNTTVAALMTLARGGCYAPRCGAPTVRFIDGEPVLSLEIAHIRALKPGGRRFDSTWTMDQRNSFANLLLLCNVHHKRVDGARGDRYTVAVLEGWKRVREADGRDALAGLSGLTENRLVAMICEAQEAYAERIGSVLGELATAMPEISSLLKIVRSDVEKWQGQRPEISEDIAWMLRQAGSDLSHLQDTAPWLMEAGRDLKHLQDNASLLVDAADALGHMEGLAGDLRRAAQEVSSAAAALHDARF